MSTRAARRLLLLAGAVALLGGCRGSSSTGPADPGLGPVPAGRRALKQGNFPWYDGEQDGVRRVSVSPPEDDFSGRRSNWETKSQPPKNPNRRSSAVSETMQLLVWVLGTVLLACLIALLVWSFMRASGEGKQRREPPAPPPAARIDRVEELPVPIDARQGDLLDQARAHFAGGNLRDAIIALYSYQLIQLDNSQVIHLERGKTNRQYLREIRGQQRLRELLEGTMVAFEDAFFGNHQLASERVEACLSRVDEFRQALQGAP